MDIENTLEYAIKHITNLDQSHSRFQKMVFPEGISYDKKSGFGTAKLGLIYQLNRDFKNDKSSLVDITGLEPVTSTV